METLAANACYGGGYSINNVTFLNCEIEVGNH